MRSFLKLERNLEKLKLIKTRKEREEFLPIIENDLKYYFNTEVLLDIYYTGDIYNCLVICYPSIPKTLQDEFPKKDPNLHFINIHIGIKLIQLLEPRELIAILLHEFKHWNYLYETYLPLLNWIIQKIRLLGSLGYIIFGTVSIITFPIFILLLLISATSSSLLSHNIEKGCDESAVANGYGSDLYSGFRKLNKLQKRKKESKITSILNSIIKYLFGSSHPSFDERMKIISSHLQEKYKDIYNTPKQKYLIEKYYKIELN